jgi:lysophospholipase L1-like esterase
VIATMLALILLPCGVGAAAGAAARAVRGRRLTGLIPALAAFAVPFAVALVVARPPGPVGFWDAALAGLMAGAAFVWVAHRGFEDRAQRRLVLSSAAIAGLVAEGAARLLLPTPPGFPPAREARFFASREESQGQALICDTTYGGWPADPDGRTLRADRYRVPTGYARRALFIGDSMTWGVGANADETFPALLGAADPETLVVNAAASAIGPDGYLVLMRQWLPLLEPDLVVFGLFDGNDLTEIDAPYPCCGDQPLLAYGPGGPRLRCPKASVAEAALGVRAYLASPPPYLLRVLAGSSAMASLAAAGFAGLTRGTIGEGDAVGAAAHLEIILRAARDEVAQKNGTFAVVLLPTRADLEEGNPTARHFRGYGLQMAEVARRLGILVLDPWGAFQAAVRDRGSSALFADVIHLGPAGHRLLASWLRERLPGPCFRLQAP